MKKKLSLLMAMSMGVCSVSSVSMTASAETSYDYEVKSEVRIYDSVTGETVENIIVKMCTFDLGPLSVYEEWNTSDSNPHFVSIPYDSSLDEDGDGMFDWQLEIDELPEGYSFKGLNYFDSCMVSSYVKDGVEIYDIPLDPIGRYPLRDTVKCSFSLEDKTTGESLDGVKVKLYFYNDLFGNINENNPDAEWIYKQDEIVDVPVYFKNATSASSAKLVFEGLPENYTFHPEKYTNNYMYINADDNTESLSLSIDEYNRIKQSGKIQNVRYTAIDKELLKNIEYTYRFWFTLPPTKMTYLVGEELDVSGALIAVAKDDEDKHTVEYYHQPMSSSMFRLEYDEFTEVGEYLIKIYRQKTNEHILTLAVDVIERELEENETAVKIIGEITDVTDDSVTFEGYNSSTFKIENPELIDELKANIGKEIKMNFICYNNDTLRSINYMYVSDEPKEMAADLTGDANCDGSVNIADATAIVQYIGNPDKYPLSEQGLKNADCCNTGDGITGMDAIAIQKLEAKIIDSL